MACGLVSQLLQSVSSWIYWHDLLHTSVVEGTGEYMMGQLKTIMWISTTLNDMILDVNRTHP